MLYSVCVDREGIILPANNCLFPSIPEADEEARRLYQAYYNEAAEPDLVKGAYFNFADKADTAPTFIVWNQTENRIVREHEFDLDSPTPYRTL